MDTPTETDLAEFRAYVCLLTDRQVIECYHRERNAGRDAYAALAKAEAELRGFHV